MNVVLPWPDRKLSPNVRAHWAAKHRAAKAAKQTSQLETHMALADATDEQLRVLAKAKAGGRIRVRIVLHPPDARRRDMDNVLASLKHPLDGVAAALGVDDARFDLECRWGEPELGGAVSIDLLAPVEVSP